MAFVAVRLEWLLTFAAIGDGFLPGHRIRHALTLLGSAVGYFIVLLGGEHGPHDRQALVDVLGDGRGLDLHADGLDLPIRAGHRRLGAIGDGDHRRTSAGAALSGHGEDIHVCWDAHVAHGALPRGRHAIALGPLVDHGDVLQDDVAVGTAIDAGLGSGEEFGVGDTATAAFVGRFD